MDSFETKPNSVDDNNAKDDEKKDYSVNDESINSARDSILEDGFYSQADASFGELVQKLDAANFALWSAEGLTEFDIAMLQDEFTSRLIRSLFSWCGLSNYIYINARPGAAYTFLKEPAAILDCLIIRWAGINTTFTIWKGSHKYAIRSIVGDNNFWRVPEAQLKKFIDKNVEKVTYNFPEGGLLITAPGTAVETSQGIVVGSIIGTQHAIQAWGVRSLSNSSALRECIGNMKRSWFEVVVRLI